MTPETMLTFSSKFSFYKVKGVGEVHIEKRGENTWAIYSFGKVLAHDGGWIYEPLPSSRTDEFIASTRYSLEEAFKRVIALGVDV